jgi:aldose 1-epimerase
MVISPGYGSLDKVAARLHDPASGRVLEVRTSETSIQLFTPAGERPGLTSEDGKPFTPAPAVALETEHLPDSPNFAQFPSTVLRPGQTFHSTTIFAFKTDKP